MDPWVILTALDEEHLAKKVQCQLVVVQRLPPEATSKQEFLLEYLEWVVVGVRSNLWVGRMRDDLERPIGYFLEDFLCLDEHIGRLDRLEQHVKRVSLRDQESDDQVEENRLHRTDL